MLHTLTVIAEILLCLVVLAVLGVAGLAVLLRSGPGNPFQ